MGRDELSTTGPADEAQTPPPSVPASRSTSDVDPLRRLLLRRLAHQTALAQFARRALNATTVEPLRAEATALADQVFPVPASGAFELDLNADEEDVAFAAAVADILRAASGKINAVAASEHASLHDPLTGLANRSLVLDHLHRALARAERRSSLAAVVFLDLDDFKPINDTLGHRAGDEILVRIAERLRAAIRPSDTLGRWGGDEFVVVCEDLEQASDAPAIVARLAAAFDEPFATHGTDLHVTASIGVALSGGGDGPAALIHAADAAMYRVKHDLAEAAGDRAGPATPVLPTAVEKPKLEQLVSRLLDLVSKGADADTPTDRKALPVPADWTPADQG
jgi:diguanylate cyclase (GGDEF)-like protein